MMQKENVLIDVRKNYLPIEKLHINI